jgi:hypothetical protein
VPWQLVAVRVANSPGVMLYLFVFIVGTVGVFETFIEMELENKAGLLHTALYVPEVFTLVVAPFAP